MKNRSKIWILGLLFLLLSCTTEPSIAEQRAQQAAQADREGTSDIVIAVAWPFSTSYHLLRQGIELAVQQINDEGGILGRPLTVRWWMDDQGSTSHGRLVAQYITNDSDVVAVIGHYKSDVSISASTIYQFSGILMLSPGSTNAKLTEQGLDLVFRSIPTDEEIGSRLAQYAQQQGYQRMLILAAKDTYGRGLANVFELEAPRQGIEIVDRLSYLPGSDDAFFKQILGRWKQLDFDAILVAGTTPEAARFIRQMGKAGIFTPVLGGDGLDSPELWGIGGHAAQGTVVATSFHHDAPGSERRTRFNTVFVDKYGIPPDAWAAQGYDAVKLLAYAMEKAGSTVPAKIGQALRSIDEWQGVTGSHTFDDNGNVSGKPVVLQQVQGAQFKYLSGAD